MLHSAAWLVYWNNVLPPISVWCHSPKGLEFLHCKSPSRRPSPGILCFLHTSLHTKKEVILSERTEFRQGWTETRSTRMKQVCTTLSYSHILISSTFLRDTVVPQLTTVVQPTWILSKMCSKARGMTPLWATGSDTPCMVKDFPLPVCP